MRRAVLPLCSCQQPFPYIISADLRSGQNQDGTGVEFKAGADGSHGTRLRSIGWSWGQTPQLVEMVDVWDGNFSQQAGLVHHRHSLLRVVSLGSLPRQHNTVGAIQNSVTNIANLGAGWARVVCHRLEHLCSANSWLSGQVALGNHHLLSNEDLSRRNLDTKITTCNHDSISLFEDLVEIVHTLLVLDLGNDLDLFSCVAKYLTDGSNVAAVADERSEDHVDLILDAEAEVVLVFLRERRQIDIGPWKIDTLLGRDLAVVHASDTESLIVHNFENLKR